MAAVVGVIALVAAPILLIAGLRTGDDQDPVTVAPTVPAPTTDPIEPGSPETSAPTPDEGNPIEDLFGGGAGDGALDGLLGSDTLAQCLAPPGMTPNFEGSSFPDDPAAAIDVISEQIETTRGLAFTTPVELELLNSEELATRIVEVSDEDYPPDEANLDDAILTTLGQLDPDQDLRQIYFDLLGEQVAGFYDSETGELVAESGGDLAADDMIIVAHELDHALTDQALGLPEFEGMEQDVDGLIAQQGLVEGDATVLMQQWALGNLSLFDMMALGTTPVDTAQLDTAPWVLQAQLLYPYEAGLEFVCSLYISGGWAAVDAVYSDLPTTSAQILFPERYLDRQDAVEVPAVSTTQPDWQEARTTTWGAADLQWLIEAPGNEPTAGPPDALERAADWAGGHQTTWQRGEDTMVSLDLVQQPDGVLCTTMRDWVEAAWTDAAIDTSDDTTTVWTTSVRAVALTCAGDAVSAVVGPDVESVTSVG